MPARPKRPFRNLGEFRLSGFYPWKTERWLAENLRKWPCLWCSGRGWDYDPADPPDVIEGNKHRDRLRCPHCGGTGCGPKEAVVNAYKEKIRRFHEEAQAYNALIKTYKIAIQKLTKEELSALQELGL